MEEHTKTKKKNLTGYYQNMDKDQVGNGISFSVEAKLINSKFL